MDNYKFTEFGNRLKTLREQCHFKQGELADKIGITRQSMKAENIPQTLMLL